MADINNNKRKKGWKGWELIEVDSDGEVIDRKPSLPTKPKYILEVEILVKRPSQPRHKHKLIREEQVDRSEDETDRDDSISQVEHDISNTDDDPMNEPIPFPSSDSEDDDFVPEGSHNSTKRRKTGLQKRLVRRTRRGSPTVSQQSEGDDENSWPEDPHSNLLLRGGGLSQRDFKEIRYTLGPLRDIEIPGLGAQQVSIKHFNQYFYWVAERQRVFERRKQGLQPMFIIQKDRKPQKSWSMDPFFSIPLSNVFRHQDNSSQYIIEHVIDGYEPTGIDPEHDVTTDNRYDEDGRWIDNLQEACWRNMVYWQFCRTETWVYLKQALGGDVRWATYNYETYAGILRRKLQEHPGQALFTGSYQIHPDKRYNKGVNYGNAFACLEAMMTGNTPIGKLPPIPEALAATHSLEEAHSVLQLYPGIGNYHGLQLALNLNYSKFINLSTTEWICAGRGAKNGLSLIIPTLSQSDPAVKLGLNWLMSQQWDEWKRLGYTPISAWSDTGRPHDDPGVDLVDLENSLCIYQKYARAMRKTEIYAMSQGKDPQLLRVAEEAYNPFRGEAELALGKPVVIHIPKKGQTEEGFMADIVEECKVKIEVDELE